MRENAALSSRNSRVSATAWWWQSSIDPGDRGRRDRPQRRHRFDRGEGQVVAGHRGGRRPRMAGDEPRQFPVVGRWAGVGFGEHVPGPSAVRMTGPDVGGDTGVRVVADGGVVVAVGLPQPGREPVFLAVDRERADPAARRRSRPRWPSAKSRSGGAVIRSALGCRPSPNRAFIWASLTCDPCGDTPQLGHQRIGDITGDRAARARPARGPSTRPGFRLWRCSNRPGWAGPRSVASAAATCRIRYMYPSPAVSLCKPITASSPEAEIMVTPLLRSRPLPNRDLSARGVMFGEAVKLGWPKCRWVGVASGRVQSW